MPLLLLLLLLLGFRPAGDALLWLPDAAWCFQRPAHHSDTSTVTQQVVSDNLAAKLN
jgi:hypothetical protein